MAATYLSSVLTDVTITLVESKRVPVIGVGEATLPSLIRFMNRIGLTNQRAWLKDCDATIKTGISFRNWLDKGDSYWHPFEALEYVDGNHHTGHCWVHLNRKGDPDFSTRQSFYESFHVTQTLNHEQDRGPVVRSYAFHLDAGRFGQLLYRAARSVRHIVDDVVDVHLNELGDIKEILTQDCGLIGGDLFVDCSGFSRCLINRLVSDNQFDSYARSLLCDRAVVLRYPYEENSARREIQPYVTASAVSAGWVWRIPLFSRMSSGYVYSSAFISDSDAEQELRGLCGQDRTCAIESHRIRFETGKLRRVWSRNCVAIGLAGGFIEPLESTGLALTQLGIELLASILDLRYYNDNRVERYNMYMGKLYDDITDFVVAHYCLTRRSDTPFWLAARHATQIPESLNERLDVFRRLLPSIDTKGVEEPWFFRDFSWFAVLLGMDFPFEMPDVSNESISRAKIIRQKNQMFVRQCTSPLHFDCLKQEIFDRDASQPGNAGGSAFRGIDAVSAERLSSSGATSS